MIRTSFLPRWRTLFSYLRKALPGRTGALFCAIIALAIALFNSPLFGQEVVDAGAQLLASPESAGQIETPPLIAQMAVLVGLSLLPFFVMLMNSFLKMVIVLSLLRSALGVQQAPPNQVLNGIALILTIYVMFPTGMSVYNRIEPLLQGELPKELISRESAEFVFAIATEAKEPLREFLIKNTRDRHERSFYKLAQRYFPPQVQSSLKMTDFIILAPAFITSQIEDAFQIGVLIYLPFFVVDLVTSNVLLAMGMMMLSPMTIALPLKLLLLVMLDGWTILVQGLVMTFKT